jgi:hypothetical protein
MSMLSLHSLHASIVVVVVIDMMFDIFYGVVASEEGGEGGPDDWSMNRVKIHVSADHHERMPIQVCIFPADHRWRSPAADGFVRWGYECMDSGGVKWIGRLTASALWRQTGLSTSNSQATIFPEVPTEHDVVEGEAQCSTLLQVSSAIPECPVSPPTPLSPPFALSPSAAPPTLAVDTGLAEARTIVKYAYGVGLISSNKRIVEKGKGGALNSEHPPRSKNKNKNHTY